MVDVSKIGQVLSWELKTQGNALIELKIYSQIQFFDSLLTQREIHK